MKKTAIVLFLLASLPCLAQTDNTFYAKQFQGGTVGAKVTAAQAACNTNTAIPCIIVLDPSLAVYPAGTMPVKCTQCIWNDYRIANLGWAPLTGATFTGPVSASSIGNIVYANQYPGAHGGAQIDAAVTASQAATTGPITIISSPGMSAGVQSVTPRNNVTVIDYRGTQDSLNNETGTTIYNTPVSQFSTQILGDFTTLALPGIVTLTHGSTALTGVGTNFSTQLNPGATYGPSIKLTGDASTAWDEVCSVASNTSATLCNAYSGTGGSGVGLFMLAEQGQEIRAMLTAGTPNTLKAGEWVGQYIIANRSGGERGLYGENINLSYSTPVQANQGQVEGLEIDISNNSGANDPSNGIGIGIDLLSAGINFPWVALKIQGNWQYGEQISGYKTAGLLVNGPQRQIIIQDSASGAGGDANPAIEVQDSTGLNTAYITNSGLISASGFFGPATGLTGTAESLKAGNTSSLLGATVAGTYPGAVTAMPELLFTLTSGTNATYIVHCNALADDGTYGASGIVTTSNTALFGQLAHGANMTMTLSGFGVYCSQNSGATQIISWSYARIM
jgi:hypothetical protein